MRPLVVRVVTLAVLGSTRLAAAQELPPLPPPGDIPVAPGASVQAPVPAVAAHLRAKQSGVAKVFHVTNEGGLALVCVAPCEAQLPPGARLRATWNDGDAGHDFTLAGAAGEDVDVAVGAPKRGALAAGIVLTSLGALTMLVGGIVAARGENGSLGPGAKPEDLRPVGWVTLGIGTAITIGGVALIFGSSTEPRVSQQRLVAGRPTEDMRLPRVSTASLAVRF